MLEFEITKCDGNLLKFVVPLFDQYRQFYGRESDLEVAGNFLQQRIENEESVVFLAHTGDKAHGFTQLYPGFSSVAAYAVWTLNDLYVTESSRKQGVAGALMEAAENFARESGAKRIVLETYHKNFTAKKLYESRQWLQDLHAHHYQLELT